MLGKKKLLFLVLILAQQNSFAQSSDLPKDLILEDPEDIKLLEEEFQDEAESEVVIGDEDTEVDDLESLRTDLGELEFELPKDDELLKKTKSKKAKISDTNSLNGDNRYLFEIGAAEKELLDIAKNMQGKIPTKEWNEIAATNLKTVYTVTPGDWLWKISKKFFGSGFYYSKIWALNPYITNPHEIEPGMILTFSTGTGVNTPEVTFQTGEFANTGSKLKTGRYDNWGDEATPDWVKRKEKLQEDGVFFQYSTLETDADLDAASRVGLIKEYEAYEPPRPDFEIEIPVEQYDSSGFDKSAKIDYEFKEGFYLNTFVSTNIVQDFGRVDSAINEQALFSRFDKVYVKFDEGTDVIAGDKFSVYSADGKVTNENSDRKGLKYTITASLQTITKVGDKWECMIIDSTMPVQRDDRITIYTPRIERITQTFNSRLIEAILLNNFKSGASYASFGDVVYIDRGRADGVEMGNVFEVYGFKDRGTGVNITQNPTYKNGELTVITLSDNFATALITSSVRDFKIGDIAVTKTKEQAARDQRLKTRMDSNVDNIIEDQALEELDVELNIDDLNEALLDKADRIQFTEDELAELERQEREKSFMTDAEKDLKSLERLEKEIETAEKMLNEARLDEDKLLEGENLDNIENSLNYQQQESLDEIEENFGKRYLDEDLNDKDNPYGLTEFDIEEIDELLNSDQIVE